MNAFCIGKIAFHIVGLFWNSNGNGDGIISVSITKSNQRHPPSSSTVQMLVIVSAPTRCASNNQPTFCTSISTSDGRSCFRLRRLACASVSFSMAFESSVTNISFLFTLSGMTLLTPAKMVLWLMFNVFDSVRKIKFKCGAKNAGILAHIAAASVLSNVYE